MTGGSGGTRRAVTGHPAPAARVVIGAVAAVVLAAAASTACTEDPLTSLDRDSAPGTSTSTLEFRIDSADLLTWRDTTVTGFALPSSASFTVISNRPELRARTLLRYNVPDTIRTFSDTLPPDTFESADLLVALDTASSELSGVPLTLRALALTQGFDADSATWTRAASGAPWATPGGDFGIQLASAGLAVLSDTLTLEFEVPVDSLLKAWIETDGQPGFALVVDGPEASVRLRQVSLRYSVVLQGRTAAVAQTQVAEIRTFITDPPPPPPASGLRIGGLPASRLYFDFTPPESLGGIPVRGSTINHAVVIFHPLPPPDDPYPMERSLSVRPITLLSDPFALGVKTPIGPTPLAFTTLNPDSLAAGVPTRLDVTALVRGALSGEGAVRPIRMGLRADPDAQTLGFWEFGSREAPEGLRPELRIFLSPPGEFTIP